VKPGAQTPVPPKKPKKPSISLDDEQLIEIRRCECTQILHLKAWKLPDHVADRRNSRSLYR
jgi:hypothetical protein